MIVERTESGNVYSVVGTVLVSAKLAGVQFLLPTLQVQVALTALNGRLVRDLYISRISLPILLQGNMRTDPENI